MTFWYDTTARRPGDLDSLYLYGDRSRWRIWARDLLVMRPDDCFVVLYNAFFLPEGFMFVAFRKFEDSGFPFASRL